MNTKSRTYYSSTYQAFLEIEPEGFQEQIKYFEKNRGEIRKLDFSEYFDVLVHYNKALFETANYSRQISTAEEILELSIAHNITTHQDEDVFFETLFKKAASLYNLHQIDEAIYMLKELLKMNPDHESSKLFMINCFVKQKKQISYPFRMISISAILLSAVIIAIELLVFRTLKLENVDIVELIRNALFLGGVIVLILGEVWLRYVAVDKTLNIIKNIKASRREKVNS